MFTYSHNQCGFWGDSSSVPWCNQWQYSLIGEYGKYGATKSIDYTTMRYDVIKVVSYAYKLKEDTTYDGKN